MKCKACKRKYHWCYNCGYDHDLHPLSVGYCSWKCLREDGGPDFTEDEDDEWSRTRLRACLLACAGLTTEQLEAMGEGGVQRLVEALKAAVRALDYANMYYLLESEAAEMYAHCNGYANSPDVFAALAPFAGDTEGVE